MQLRCDRGQPAGDLFTAAMNMILPHQEAGLLRHLHRLLLQRHQLRGGRAPTCSTSPPAMSSWTGSRRSARIQDLEMLSRSRMHRAWGARGPELPAEPQRPAALRGSAALPSLAGDARTGSNWRTSARWAAWTSVPGRRPSEEPLPEGRIVRQEPLMRSPPPGPRAGEAAPRRGKEGGLARLEPQPRPPGQPAAPNAQTMVVPVDRSLGLRWWSPSTGGGERRGRLAYWRRRGLPAVGGPGSPAEQRPLPPRGAAPAPQAEPEPPGPAHAPRRSSGGLCSRTRSYISRSSPQPRPTTTTTERGWEEGRGQPLSPGPGGACAASSCCSFSRSLARTPALSPRGRHARPSPAGAVMRTRVCV